MEENKEGEACKRSVDGHCEGTPDNRRGVSLIASGKGKPLNPPPEAMAVFAAEFLHEAANYVPSVAHRWEFIGIKLYQGNLVQTLRYSERSAPQKLTEILQGWLNGPRAPVDELAAWIELVKALKSPAVDVEAIAKKIEEVIHTGLDYEYSSSDSFRV